MIRISLKGRILLILSSFVVITFCGGLVLIWYTLRMDALVATIVDRDLSAFQAAQALENSLIRQKGFVSYYFIDGDPDWLNELETYRSLFSDQLEKIKAEATGRPEKEILASLEAEYQHYVDKKDRVIALYKAGDSAAGRALHREVRKHFDTLIGISEEFKQIHTDRILKAAEQNHAQAGRLRIIAFSAIFVTVLLTVILAFILVNQILGPVHRLAVEADRERGPKASENDITALSRSVRGLLQDVDQTQSELERSRESLVQAEKMALVGKLAASMAHSIRNPFTSVKMRLFSLSRSLDLDTVQKEDFEAISAEIRHIDTIVQNFLEFSRPPRLKMQRLDPSSVVDSAVQLLAHRLKSYEVTVQVQRIGPLPTVTGDPEQLKEVIVNLIVNACEAMPKGGSIFLEEGEDGARGAATAAVIRVRDTGPGIPAAHLDKVFQPFFSTKEEGTGLGLSIAQRIISDHHGRLEVTSIENRGTTFIITLPAGGADHESHPGD
jgi:signal transduction histidine kinase